MKAAADDILKAENRRVTDLFAADITLYNEDGEAVQPDGSVKVTFEGTTIGNSGTRVLYMGENASDTEKMCIRDRLYMDGSSGFCLCVRKKRPHENGLPGR